MYGQKKQKQLSEFTYRADNRNSVLDVVAYIYQSGYRYQNLDLVDIMTRRMK